MTNSGRYRDADVGACQTHAPAIEIVHAMPLEGKDRSYIRAQMSGGVTGRSEISNRSLRGHAEKLNANHGIPALVTAPLDRPQQTSPSRR